MAACTDAALAQGTDYPIRLGDLIAAASASERGRVGKDLGLALHGAITRVRDELTPSNVESPPRLAGEPATPAETSSSPSLSRARADQLYRQYGPAIYRKCLRLLRDEAAAHDATQEVFIKLLRNRRMLEDPAGPLSWAFRVATNHCLNLLRDARARREESLDAGVEERPALDAVRLDDTQLAKAILSRCDAQTRVIAVAVYVDGMEHEEIAELLGLSRRTVSRKLVRFLEKARTFLARSGHPSWARAQ